MEELHVDHCSFNADLSAAHNPKPSPNKMTISQVFLKHKEIFLQYGYYCSNLMPAQEVIDDVMKDPTARQKIEASLKSFDNMYLKFIRCSYVLVDLIVDR